MKNNNISHRDNNSNNSHRDNSNQSSNQHDRRKNHNHQQNQHTYQPQQFHGQRERSGQRNQGAQHPDSSVGRDNSMNQLNQSNLGSVRFIPGFPTKELPPIETKADPNKKFTGRCRLFIGNLPHNTSEGKLRTLFETYGEVGEVFLGPKSAFAFIKMDTRQNAEAARDALDCTNYENRTLRVRLAAHAAAIRVKHLSPHVTNELLAYAFRYFGEIERAVVVVDDKGKSTGEGVVEYSKKQSAIYAVKRCHQECFMLTASPKPVLVELFDQQDEDEGLPEKSANKNSNEFKEHREVGPRFAEQGTFEHSFGLKWKELYDIEKQKRDRLELEIQEARNNLENQFEYSRIEHKTMSLKSQLEQLENNKLRLQHMKEQTMNESQQRGEQRRQQDMLMRQREQDILRQQQLGNPDGFNQQETTFRMQDSALQDLLNNQDYSTGKGESTDSNQPQQSGQASSSQMGPEAESSIPTTVLASPLPPTPARSFADAAMMLNNQQYIPVQQQMGMPPSHQNLHMNPPNMFTAYMPQHQMQMSMDVNQNFAPGYAVPQQTAPVESGRQQKFSRQYNSGVNSSNNINLSQGSGGRQRKRGRY